MRAKLRLTERITALVMALLFCLSGVFAGNALMARPYWNSPSWQETIRFENLLHSYIDRTRILLSSCVQLQKAREESTSYVERQQLENSVKDQLKELSPEQTWFRFEIKSADGKTSYYRNANTDEAMAVQNIYYAIFRKGDRVPGEGIGSDYNINQHGRVDPDEIEEEIELSGDPSNLYVIECGVAAKPVSGPRDLFSQLYQTDLRNRQGYPKWMSETMFFLSAGGLCLLVLLVVSGRRAMEKDYAPLWIDRTWLEPVLLFFLLIEWVSIMWLLPWLVGQMKDFFLIPNDHWLPPLLPWCMGGLAVVTGVTGAAILRTVVVRFCAHTIRTCTIVGCLLKKLGGLIRRCVSAIPLLWRGGVVLLVLLCLSIAMLRSLDSRIFIPMFLLWLAAHTGVLIWLCMWSISFHRLKEGAKTIAAGNLNHQIDTGKMPRELREHGETLNNISQGLSSAVDEKTKSERFKAELITNVSHDLKTPLTSILNYVGLLKTTDQQDPRALEYIEVLDRKSQRLKKLTEDLVEASKASTGVLSVRREKISLSQLLSQAMGEWEEKLNDCGLTVVTSLPEGETWVSADGRHLWRVIDNLLSNCCKYAMEGTRIYIDLSRSKGNVSLSVKNVSREQLNIPPERLMERFVRGEASRSTEGSGLGLSIARSLTELQGGTFELSVDGDLFKAVVTLPQAG